jgi:hypothetical protein
MDTSGQYLTVVARSALGITQSGELVWAAGEQLSPAGLAEALIAAGAVRAIELDINPAWVAGYLYVHHPTGPTAVRWFPASAASPNSCSRRTAATSSRSLRTDAPAGAADRRFSLRVGGCFGFGRVAAVSVQGGVVVRAAPRAAQPTVGRRATGRRRSARPRR